MKKVDPRPARARSTRGVPPSALRDARGGATAIEYGLVAAAHGPVELTKPPA